MATTGGDRSVHGARLGSYNPEIFFEHDAVGAGGDRDRDRDGSTQGGSEDNYDGAWVVCRLLVVYFLGCSQTGGDRDRDGSIHNGGSEDNYGGALCLRDHCQAIVWGKS
jgi:hypothetical protein